METKAKCPVKTHAKTPLESGRKGRKAYRAPAPALPTKPRAVFRIKEMAGRYYADRDAIVAVADACRVAQVSMDQLAVKLGISRPALVLILNGTDPISNTMVEQLRGFVTQQALA